VEITYGIYVRFCRGRWKCILPPRLGESLPCTFVPVRALIVMDLARRPCAVSYTVYFSTFEREREPADSAKARFATTRGDLAIAQPRFLLVLPRRPLHLPPGASAREIVVSRGFTRLIREVNGRALDAKEINFQTYIMSNCSATRRVAKLA